MSFVCPGLIFFEQTIEFPILPRMDCIRFTLPVADEHYVVEHDQREKFDFLLKPLSVKQPANIGAGVSKSPLSSDIPADKDHRDEFRSIKEIFGRVTIHSESKS